MGPAQPPAWSDHVHAVLGQAGLRRGGARERIIELLASQSCALSAVEIEDALSAQGRRTGRASIYRVLDLLVEHGLVERVAVDKDQARFERVLPIHKVSERLGVRVDHHEVVLRGACDNCD